jgi:aminoglycoside phosphotransferase (APT) family kinase protein
MSSVVFPIHVEELTPELLTRALAERHPNCVVESLCVVEQAHCKSGSASTAARAVLDLEYRSTGADGPPERLVLKTVLIRPGSIPDLYENEVRFYRDLRPELELETPRAYASCFDADTGTFGVLMEDLGLRAARFPDARESLERGAIESLLDGLAVLHARFWRSPRFDRDLADLWTPRSGGFHDFLKAHGLEFIRQLVGRSPYKQELLARLGRSLDQVWEALWQAQEILAGEPCTLLHGDTHLGNTYLLPDGDAGLIDWQLMSRGRWVQDVTYLMVTGLSIEVRRRDERELLALYLERLRARGVSDTPTAEDAWWLYRRTAIWGFLLGWMICPVENYGETILRANLERLTTALEDLETFQALGS